MAEQAKLLAAYLAVGPDEMKRARAIDKLKSRLNQSFITFNLDEISVSAELTPESVLSSAQTLPMGDSRRIVVIDDAGKLPKSVSEALVEYLKNPNPTTTLMLSAKTLAKTTRLYKAVDVLGKLAVINCGAMTRSELPKYIGDLGRKYGLQIPANVANELVSRVGDNTTMLDSQIKSLAALLGRPGAIDVQFVETHVARVVEVKPWDFLDSLSARNAQKALELYSQMDESGAIGNLSLMTGRVRELICARSMVKRGTEREIAPVLGKQDWQVRNYARWARQFADGELEHILGLCADAERGLKSGEDKTTTMTKLIFALCGVANV